MSAHIVECIDGLGCLTDSMLELSRLDAAACSHNRRYSRPVP